LANAEAGIEVPFATVDLATGRAIGSSRYMNIVLEHRRVEIGWTWVAPPWQRTGANREAKLLMLGHAFEVLGCRRVEFKTDALNERANPALANTDPGKAQQPPAAQAEPKQLVQDSESQGSVHGAEIVCEVISGSLP
jgi:hypothetical protein